MLERGYRSLIFAPLVFSERVDGVLILAKRRPHWYENADAEVARALAEEVMVAIQHQRLAEERQRLDAVEARAIARSRAACSSRSPRDAASEQVMTRARIIARDSSETQRFRL